MIRLRGVAAAGAARIVLAACTPSVKVRAIASTGRARRIEIMEGGAVGFIIRTGAINVEDAGSWRGARVHA